MTELALTLVEAIGAGITVHAWDTGNVEMFLGGIVYLVLFLLWGVAMMIEEVQEYED